MANRNTSHLAGEFLVAGELSRRGYAVSITMGNAKAVDIHADTSERGTIKIDAKAGRAKGNWPIAKSSVQEDLYYVFVHLQTKNKIERNPPEYFVASGKEILSKDLIKTWKTRQGIPYKTLNAREYRERWNKLPSP